MSYNHKRLVALGLLLLIMITSANYYLSLGFLPRFSGALSMLIVVVGLLWFLRFGPTLEEMERHKGRKDANRK